MLTKMKMKELMSNVFEYEIKEEIKNTLYVSI